MERFTWTREYSVGIDSIDQQHKHWFNLLGTLADAAEAPDADTRAALEETIGFTKAHFRTEELLMEQHAYTGLEWHRWAHDRFLDELRALRKAQSGTFQSRAAVKALGVWLTRHVLVADKRYSAYLIERGVQ